MTYDCGVAYIPPTVQYGICGNRVLCALLWVTLSFFSSAQDSGGPLDDPGLQRIRGQSTSYWELDSGTKLQVQDLIHRLRHKNSLLVDEYDGREADFEKILVKKNITVSSDFGSATRVKLPAADGSGELVHIKLNHSHGEAVDVVLIDSNSFSPSSNELHVYLSELTQYEPTDVTHSKFGKSVLLVSCDWMDDRSVAVGLNNESNNLFFPRGFSLPAWIKASFFKPSWESFWVTSLTNTPLQCAGTVAACKLADHLNIAHPAWYIPFTLNVLMSSVIGANVSTHATLSRKGTLAQRVMYNFFVISMSFAIGQSVWDGILHHGVVGGLEHAFSVGNIIGLTLTSLIGNYVKMTLDSFGNFRRDSRLVDGSFMSSKVSKAQFETQLWYSFVANPLRLVSLMAESAVKGGISGEGNSGFVKMGVRSFYLLCAGLAQMGLVKYAERKAAEARLHPEKFRENVDLKTLKERTAQLRKSLEELKDKIRRIPEKSLSLLKVLVLGRPDPYSGFSHKRVHSYFQAWVAARQAYLYRMGAGEQISEEELARYRQEVVEEIVKLSLESAMIHGFEGARPATAEELDSFVRYRARTQQEKVAAVTNDLLLRSYSDQKRAVHEYGSILTDVIDVLSERIRNSPKAYSQEIQSRVVGFVNHLVDKFPEDAAKLDAEFVSHWISERMGVFAAKGLEHYSSRLVMWRYLYGKQLPRQNAADFIRYLNSEDKQGFDHWVDSVRRNYGSGLDGAHVEAHKKELSEISSLSSELRRRVSLKLAELGVADVDETHLKYFKDELLAFSALMDFQQKYSSRWLEGASLVPQPLWSYQYERRSLDAAHVKKVQEGRACLARLRASMATVPFRP